MTNDSGTPQATREDATSDGGTDDRAGGPDGGPDGRTAGADAAGSGESSTEPTEFADAKERAIGAAEELIDHPIDSVIRIERTGEGWRTLVEVVERSAVPDTQDILGRYEIVADDTGTLRKYGLMERYRRGESREEL